MTTDAGKHRENAEEFLDHAEDMVVEENNLQASEKIWGAVSQTLKEIAEKHGWPNESHNDLRRIAGYLAAVADDGEITAGFSSASDFHTNFYEDTYAIDQITHGLRKAEETVERLRKADAQADDGVLPPNGGSSPEDYYARLKHQGSNATLRALREQELTNDESGYATRIINAAKFPMVDALSFKIGADRRRVTVSGDGRPKVGKPAPKSKRLTMEQLTAEIQQPGQRRRSSRYWPR